MHFRAIWVFIQKSELPNDPDQSDGTSFKRNMGDPSFDFHLVSKNQKCTSALSGYLCRALIIRKISLENHKKTIY